MYLISERSLGRLLWNMSGACMFHFFISSVGSTYIRFQHMLDISLIMYLAELLTFIVLNLANARVSSIEKYAAPFEPFNLPSRNVSLRVSAPKTSPNSTRIPKSHSNLDMTSTDGAQPPLPQKTPTRSSSMIWSDGARPAPKMFPGVVHERTRRNSMRQNSESERDSDSLFLSRPRTKDGHEEAVPEIPAEEDE